MEITPVAIFHSPFGSKFGVPRQSGLAEVPGQIHLCGDFRRVEALRGLDSFEYIWLLWEFSGNRRTASEWQPTVRPPRLGGNRSMGVFATRSPFRPNPLGLSSVRIHHIDFEQMIIHVTGADLMDGTPIYDIKPYLEYADSHPGSGNGFVDNSSWHDLKVEIPADVLAGLEARLSGSDLAGLRAALALDPRPHYQNDPAKVYGFPFGGVDVKFRVEDDTLTVCGFSD